MSSFINTKSASTFSSLLSKLNTSGLDINIGGFTLNVPSLNVAFPGPNDESRNGTIVMSLGSLVQTMTAGARGVFCIGAILTDPELLLKTLSKCWDYILANGLALVNDIYKVCIARLNNILETVYGIVLGVFKTIKNVIGAINGIIDLVQKAIDAWKNRGKLAENKLFDKENCDFFVANLFRCMMNKLIEPYLNKFRDKVEQKINDVTANIPDKITNTVAPVTSMTNYLDNQAMFVNKFTTQVGSLF